MRWERGRRSDRIEDRRGRRAAAPISGGAGVLVLAIAALVFGVDPRVLINTGLVSTDGAAPATDPRQAAGDDRLADFVSVVLADTEDTWTALFDADGNRYPRPTLVLYSGRTPSACGTGSAAMGPFYCPADRKIYIDLAFYDDLKTRHRAPGDFAQAYVVAHEVGHHVQTVTGIAESVRRRQQGVDRATANALQVRMELQADCFAGLWAHHADRARHVLEAGDVEEALTAASAIGDDRLQRDARGVVVPESFTHGTSAQRVAWFRRGLDSGRIDACDTFSAARL